ncbi:MAG TPA: ATP synthase F0 subunit B [Terriglobales bacterium]|nr:ATP synthase F0 subunit B [Terriglobales bacterium]
MKKVWIAILTLAVCMAFASAQEHKAEPAKREPTKSEPAKASETSGPEHQGENKTEAAGEEHAGENKASAGHEGAAAGAEAKEDQHTQLTQSAVVKKLSGMLGVTPKTGYWIFVLINFAILAGGFYWVTRTSVPQMFRDRTASIQKGMEEARKASAESAARLTEIEGRLSQLDQDILNMRSQAESEAKAEEARLLAATEEEKRKIVQSAEQEIAAAASAARRDLKNLATELAVSLAEKKIAVNEATDKVLVRDFTAHLSGDAKGRS